MDGLEEQGIEEPHKAQRPATSISAQQHTVEPLAGKWKRFCLGVGLAERDPDTNLSNLRLADDMFFISGSLKHATTMLDDLTTATTAHGLQLHPTKTKLFSNTTSQRGKRQHGGSSWYEHQDPTAIRGNQIPWSTNPSLSKNAIQVEFGHRIKCAWATFTSRSQKLTSPKNPPRDRLKLFDATVPHHSSTHQQRGR